MSESVTVDHGSVSITTNTASEADLRTELETPASSGSPVASEGHAEPPPPATGRDDKGRFVPKGGAPAAPDSGDISPRPGDISPPAEAPARRRDDSLPRNDRIARMNQALAQKAEAERRAAAAEAELARYRQPGVTSPVTPPIPPAAPGLGPPSAPGGPAEPQFDQFTHEADPYTAYLQAWTRWDRQQGIAQALAEREAAHAAQARTQSFETRLAEGKTSYPDFDQVLTEADTLGLQVSAVMREAIADSPKAADLVYYLATHPEECTQLAAESVATPVAAATVMRRLLESQLAPRAVPNHGSGAAARAATSTAKPPVSPVGSSPVASDEPPGDQASAAEHARYWNRRLKVPGTR